MKKIITLALAVVLALSLANTPGASQAAEKNGSGSSEWVKGFEATTGLVGLTAYPDSTVSWTQASSRVIFTAKSDIAKDSAEYKAFLKSVWDAAATSSVDGLYELNYDGFKKGEALTDFEAWFNNGKGADILYYTCRGYVNQIAFQVNGKTITIRTDSVYNPDTKERAKP
jgi:hypothetical protein